MLLITGLSIIVLGNVAYIRSAQAIERNYQVSYESTLKNSSRVMDMNLRNLIESARSFLNNESLRSVLQSSENYPGSKFSSKDQQILIDITGDLASQYAWVNSVTIMDLYGHYYQLNNVSSGTYEFYQYYSTHDFHDEEWSEATRDAQGKELFFGKGILGTDDEDVISMAKYLINPSNGQPMGYLVVTLSRSLIGKSIVVSGTSDQSSCYMVVDANGNLVYFSGTGVDQDQVLEAYLGKEKTGSYLFSEVQNESTGWQIVNGIRKNTLNQDSRSIFITVFACGVMLIILCLLLARLISRSITYPLHKLEGVISRVGEGERHIAEHFDNSEVGVIGGKFMEMVNTNLELSEHLMEVQLNEREAEVLLLQSQINPHFLYNTLDSIYFVAIVHGDDQIADMIMALSNNFKISLNRGDKFITVEDSVLWIREYMKLQNMRYHDRFELIENVDEEILPKKILTFILQPFVENAMYHGLEPKIGKGKIVLTGYQKDQTLVFTIEDDGVGSDDPSVFDSGYGVRNVRERIRLHYGEEYGAEVESQKGKGTKVTVTVPID
jgi:two-component system sensor histidine kinase YesM